MGRYVCVHIHTYIHKALVLLSLLGSINFLRLFYAFPINWEVGHIHLAAQFRNKHIHACLFVYVTINPLTVTWSLILEK